MIESGSKKIVGRHQNFLQFLSGFYGHYFNFSGISRGGFPAKTFCLSAFQGFCRADYLVAAIRDIDVMVDGKTEEDALDLFHNSTLQKVFDFSRNFLHMNGDIIGDQIELAAQDLWDTQIGKDRRGPDMRLSAITGVPFKEQEKVGFIHHPEIWKEHTEVLARIGRTIGHSELYLGGDGYLIFSNYWSDN